jgi:hypothetical protein
MFMTADLGRSLSSAVEIITGSFVKISPIGYKKNESKKWRIVLNSSHPSNCHLSVILGFGKFGLRIIFRSRMDEHAQLSNCSLLQC